MDRHGAWVLAAVMGLGLGSATMAQNRGFDDAAVEQWFKDRDANGDGKLTLEEATAGLDGQRLEFTRRAFPVMDTDKDSHVTLEEQRAYFKKIREAFEKAETDFAAADLNTDERLTVAELTEGKPAAEAAKATELFKQTDRDNDGFVTRQEWRIGVFVRMSQENQAAAEKDEKK